MMRSHVALLLAVTLTTLAACSEPAEPPPESSASSISTESDTASLETPAQTQAGSKFEVAWTGPNGKKDYVTIVEKGAPEGTYESYKYTRDGSPLELKAVETPGEFEVRYVTGETKDTLVHAPITVTEVVATLEAPAEVGAGGSFEVSWTGPDNERDYLTVVEKEAAKGKYANYAYTRDGSPLKLTAADPPGDYEVRYVMAQSKRILARRPLRVSPVQASLSLANEVMIETPIEVTWSGPDNKDDFITIVESGAPEGTYASYSYTREGSPLEIKAPKTPGLYEMRYVMAQSKAILARAPVTVKPMTASLEAPGQIKAGESLAVTWTGPNNPRDFISIAQPSADATSYESRAYSRAGQPAQLFAPSSPGTYEIRYVLERGNQVLTSGSIEVVSPN